MRGGQIAHNWGLRQLSERLHAGFLRLFPWCHTQQVKPALRLPEKDRASTITSFHFDTETNDSFDSGWAPALSLLNPAKPARVDRTIGSVLHAPRPPLDRLRSIETMCTSKKGPPIDHAARPFVPIFLIGKVICTPRLHQGLLIRQQGIKHSPRLINRVRGSICFGSSMKQNPRDKMKYKNAQTFIYQVSFGVLGLPRPRNDAARKGSGLHAQRLPPDRFRQPETNHQQCGSRHPKPIVVSCVCSCTKHAEAIVPPSTDHRWPSFSHHESRTSSPPSGTCSAALRLQTMEPRILA